MTSAEIFDYIIIGGGASGLFCGAHLPKNKKILLVEKESSLGKKLLVAGGGACNITNNLSIKEFTKYYFENGSKIRKCLYSNSNISMMNFFENNGIPLVTRDDGKVFPKSLRSRDILNLLEKKLNENNIKILLNAKVLKVEPSSENQYKIFLKTKDNNKEKYFKGKIIIIAAGSPAFPSTGSDDSIYRALKDFDKLKIKELRPSLSPIYIKEFPYGELSGISFKNSIIRAYNNHNLIAEEQGPLLLTHNSFSGPCALHLSRYLKEGMEIKINYLGERDSSWVKKVLKEYQGKKISLPNFLCSHYDLPKNFVKFLYTSSAEKPSLTIQRLFEDTFEVSSKLSFKSAMTARGGIELDCIDLKTMMSKDYPNLYFIGEVLDVDGRTGGFNLQFAYSSALTLCKNRK